MDHVGIDFESFYNKKISKKHPVKINVQELGNYRYSMATDIHTVGIYDGEQEYVGPPEEFDWKSLAGRNLVSHNAVFDRTLYETLVYKKIISKIPRMGWWNCTANLSVYLRAGRALDNACKFLIGEEVSKDIRALMDGKTVEEMKATEATVRRFNNFYEEMLDYCLSDTKLTWRLWAECSDEWPELEKRISLITIKGCIRGLPTNKKYIERGIETLIRKRFAAIDRLPWMNDPEIENPTPQSKICLAKACRDHDIDAPASIAEDDPGYKTWKLKYADKFEWVNDMKTIGTINTVVKKFETFRDRVKPRSIYCPYGLKYGGTHTLRWSGDDGMNVQALNKEGVCGYNVRHIIQAPKGKKLIIADKTQIEARITPYLAGDWTTVELMAQGISPYVVHGINTMGLPSDFKEKQPKMYDLAKARVLSLGFQCGWERFQAQALDYGLILTKREAKKTVKDFRTTNPLIVDLWDQLNEGLWKSYRNRDKAYEIELPSGRLLQYFNLKKVKGKWGPQIQANVSRDAYKALYLYGGLLTENLVQATARDVFAEDLVRLEDYGLDILFTAHDEVCLCVDNSVTAKEVEEIMSVCPEWLPGCPVGAEAVESDHYLKVRNIERTEAR